jgi:hypothetical protein
MLVTLSIIAAAVVSIPIVMAVLVAVASRREDSQWTLAEPEPAPLQAIARRIVGFHAQGIDWLRDARPGHLRNRAQRPGGPTARALRQAKPFRLVEDPDSAATGPVKSPGGWSADSDEDKEAAVA